MYSVLLMAALTTGGETPDFCHRRCSGCYSSCHGCYSSCHGCYGCSSCYGCHGCSGCYGCYSGWGCSGCHGCSSYYGCGGYGCCGCYGGLACYGSCYGGLSCYSGCCAAPTWGYSPVPTIGCAYGVPVTPAAPAAPPADLPPGDGKKAGEASNTSSKGRLVVEVPEDARVYIDDQLMKTTSAVRKYATPTLEAGQAYYYIVKAEVVRDGKTVTDTRRVVVRAGEESRLSFDKLEPVTTAKISR